MLRRAWVRILYIPCGTFCSARANRSFDALAATYRRVLNGIWWRRDTPLLDRLNSGPRGRCDGRDQARSAQSDAVARDLPRRSRGRLRHLTGLSRAALVRSGRDRPSGGWRTLGKLRGKTRYQRISRSRHGGEGYLKPGGRGVGPGPCKQCAGMAAAGWRPAARQTFGYGRLHLFPQLRVALGRAGKYI